MFELCIPVPLYRVKEEDNLQDLIINCVIRKHHSIDINRFVRAMEVNQNRVLILLDGFDEYRGTSPVVQQIINGDRLAGCCVVITSRPYKIHEHGTKKMHRLIHLKGLNETKIKEYIRKVYTYVLRHQSPKHEVNLLYEEIKNNSLKEVAKVPLILLFICYLRYWGQQLPKRETEIYENMIKCLMAYYEGKLDRDRQGRRTRRMLDSIDISKIRDVLVAVGSIGYSGLQKNNSPVELVFAVDDLKKMCDPTLIERALQIGILAEMKDVSFLRDTTHVSFPHKTMQEFCAAFYLLQNEACDAFEEFLQNIDEISTAKILGNVAKFAVGMSNAAASKILNLIVKKLHENEGKHESSRFLNILFHLWSEANTDVYIKGTYLYFNDGTNSDKNFTHLFPKVFNQFDEITFEAVDEGVLYSAIKSLSRNRRWRKVQIKKATLSFDDYSEDLIWPYTLSLFVQEFVLDNVVIRRGNRMGFLLRIYVYSLVYVGCQGLMESISVEECNDIKLTAITMAPKHWRSLLSGKSLSTLELNHCKGLDFKPGTVRETNIDRLTLRNIEMNASAWTELLSKVSVSLHLICCEGLEEFSADACTYDEFVAKDMDVDTSTWNKLFSKPSVKVLQLVKCKGIAGCKVNIENREKIIFKHIEMSATEWAQVIKGKTLSTLHLEACRGLSGSGVEIRKCETLCLENIEMKGSDWYQLLSRATISNLLLRNCKGLSDLGTEVKLRKCDHLIVQNITIETNGWKKLLSRVRISLTMKEIRMNSSDWVIALSRIGADVKLTEFQLVRCEGPVGSTFENCSNFDRLKFADIKMEPADWKRVLGKSISTLELADCRCLRGSLIKLENCEDLTFTGIDMDYLDWEVLLSGVKFSSLTLINCKGLSDCKIRSSSCEEMILQDIDMVTDNWDKFLSEVQATSVSLTRCTGMGRSDGMKRLNNCLRLILDSIRFYDCRWMKFMKENLTQGVSKFVQRRKGLTLINMSMCPDKWRKLLSRQAVSKLELVNCKGLVGLEAEFLKFDRIFLKNITMQPDDWKNLHRVIPKEKIHHQSCSFI